MLFMMLLMLCVVDAVDDILDHVDVLMLFWLLILMIMFCGFDVAFDLVDDVDDIHDVDVGDDVDQDCIFGGQACNGLFERLDLRRECCVRGNKRFDGSILGAHDDCQVVHRVVDLVFGGFLGLSIICTAGFELGISGGELVEFLVLCQALLPKTLEMVPCASSSFTTKPFLVLIAEES